MIYILLIINALLLFVIIAKINFTKHSSPNNKFKSINIEYEKFKVTHDEIKEVENQILEKGYWSRWYEIRMNVDLESKIELEIIDGREMYLTTVRFEHEVKLTAATIERAIVFKKIYESIQFELYASLGWSSWKSKEEIV